MGVNKRCFQLIAVPFYCFVENRLINRQINHIKLPESSFKHKIHRPSCLKPSTSLFFCWKTLLEQETYTTLREGKAWRDQSRIAVQYQNLHHEEQCQVGKKRKKKRTNPFEFADGGLPSSGHLCWRSVLLLWRNRCSKAHPDVHKYS